MVLGSNPDRPGHDQAALDVPARPPPLLPSLSQPVPCLLSSTCSGTSFPLLVGFGCPHLHPPADWPPPHVHPRWVHSFGQSQRHCEQESKEFKKNRKREKKTVGARGSGRQVPQAPTVRGGRDGARQAISGASGVAGSPLAPSFPLAFPARLGPLQPTLFPPASFSLPPFLLRPPTLLPPRSNRASYSVLGAS